MEAECRKLAGVCELDQSNDLRLRRETICQPYFVSDDVGPRRRDQSRSFRLTRLLRRVGALLGGVRASLRRVGGGLGLREGLLNGLGLLVQKVPLRQGEIGVSADRGQNAYVKKQINVCGPSNGPGGRLLLRRYLIHRFASAYFRLLVLALPAQDRMACRFDFVHAAQAKRVWRSLHQRR